jgi:protein-disulfide isomerase
MSASEQSDSILELLPLRPDDHVRGNENAEITLVEFGDYECPGCAEAYFVIKKIESEMGDDLRFCFRHFPYARLHPHAELAAQAAEAAGAQGKFWEMHESLFENQQALEFDDLIARAENLQLNVEVFREALKNETYLDRVRADFRSGVQNGVFSTPGIFINGIRLNESADYDTLRDAIQREMKAVEESHQVNN